MPFAQTCALCKGYFAPARRNRTKESVSETGSGSYRSKANNSHAERNPLTETAGRQKNAAMVLPIHGGIHSLVNVPALE